MNKLFLFVLTLLVPFMLNAAVRYDPFIDQQIALTLKMDDANLTQKEIYKLVQKQEHMYEAQLDDLMVNKAVYIEKLGDFGSKIFALQKIIAINKRAGNTYAVLRDEVRIKSLKYVQEQELLVKKILLALDLPNMQAYEQKLNTLVVAEQKYVSRLYSKDYTPYLKLDNSSSKIISQLQQNIRDFYALQEINTDFIAYIYKFENRMYRLNKYSKYHIITLAIYLQSFGLVQKIDSVLNMYGLSIMKILIILFMTLLIYIFRKIIYTLIQKSFSKIDILAKYSDILLSKPKKAIESLLIIININIIIYVLNDFSNSETVAIVFNIIYGIYFTAIIYIFINALASIKVSSMDARQTGVKSELINVGLKIINFIIILIGVLIVLYLGGVDLTAVLSGLGIGGFAVAFAAKDTISNFFGTLAVLFSEVFSQGDWIEIDGKEGVVVEIGIRVTTLRTFDNALIAIPNGTFAAKDIKNWNKRKLGRRIKMSLGVKYDSKKENIVNAVNEIREMLVLHPDIASKNTKYEYKDFRRSAKLVSKEDLQGIKKTLLVYLDEFDSSSINILVYCFSKSVDWEDWLKTKQDVMEKIMDIFEKNSLEFAFPSLSIYNETQSSQKELS
ncbi:mechanosensitive ion channel family protein [Sulfurimonas sp.]|uniref:mechanosensitive ion channel family protein n=1 Tax=Sulfurimonas sp. TaxID=2022749 RepID=UPI0026222EA8|nr:mechanosensitive ion channel family protein [Sulfurimonas sp.]